MYIDKKKKKIVRGFSSKNYSLISSYFVQPRIIDTSIHLFEEKNNAGGRMKGKKREMERLLRKCIIDKVRSQMGHDEDVKTNRSQSS